MVHVFADPRYLATRNAVVAERKGQAPPSFFDRGWYVDGLVTAVQRFEDRVMARFFRVVGKGQLTIYSWEIPDLNGGFNEKIMEHHETKWGVSSNFHSLNLRISIVEL